MEDAEDPVELAGRDQIRAWGQRVPAFVDYLVQTTHPGTIQLDGDTASGRPPAAP